METMALLTLDTQVINPIWNEYASAQNIGKWLMQTQLQISQVRHFNYFQTTAENAETNKAPVFVN